MPELPEVETVRAGLAPQMEGRKILQVTLNRPNLRFPFPPHFAERLQGARVDRLWRRSKYLIANLSTGEALIAHLGMSGRFMFALSNDTNRAHDHVVMDLEGGKRLVYNDPRRFGFMELWAGNDMAAYPRFDGMGPEPLSEAFSTDYLAGVMATRTAPIKSALLDQKMIAGLGNIYVCEALYRAGISPKRKASQIGRKRLDALHGHINDVIGEAIEAGGSTLKDFAAVNGNSGYFQFGFRVYGREGEACETCGGAIKRIAQAGRSTFYCSACQK